ncbi:hypothetical protein JKP88DRAFT_346318 [Tribonema minus]|uniref:VPS9 domain-containing protein n=1 Tax=Tribonema minus TaxID=303371 RepID=A0A836CNC8_9STRA|nr:hypothetical protein JKP88DRAFT_346318 [Tribonema minus]
MALPPRSSHAGQVASYAPGTVYRITLQPSAGAGIGITVAEIDDLQLHGGEFLYPPRGMRVCPRFVVFALPRTRNGEPGRAESAGVQPGDVLIAVQELDLCDPSDPWTLLQLVTYFRDMIVADNAVQLTLLRGGHTALPAPQRGRAANTDVSAAADTRRRARTSSRSGGGGSSSAVRGSSSSPARSPRAPPWWPCTPVFPQMVEALVRHGHVSTKLSYEAQAARLLLHQIHAAPVMLPRYVPGATTPVSSPRPNVQRQQQQQQQHSSAQPSIAEQEGEGEGRAWFHGGEHRGGEGGEGGDSAQQGSAQAPYVSTHVDLKGLRKGLVVAVTHVEHWGSDSSYNSYTLVMAVLDVESWGRLLPLPSPNDPLRAQPPDGDGTAACTVAWSFLRGLSAQLLTAQLNSAAAGALLLLQSFLGVGRTLQQQQQQQQVLCDELADSSCDKSRMRVQRWMEVHVWRVLTVEPLSHSIQTFIGKTAAVALQPNAPDKSALLQSVCAFISQLQRLLETACHDPLCEGAAALQNLTADAPEAVTMDCCERCRISAATLSPEEMATAATAAIRRQLEAEIYLPLSRFLLAPGTDKSRDEAALDSSSGDGGDTAAAAAAGAVAGADGTAGGDADAAQQEAMGVWRAHVSPSAWQRAAEVMARTRRRALPCDKIAALEAASRLIPTVYAQEHPEDPAPLGADAFLPIFMYVVARSERRCAHVQVEVGDGTSVDRDAALSDIVEVMSAFCAESERLGEAGYLLATLEATAHHLHSSRGHY